MKRIITSILLLISINTFSQIDLDNIAKEIADEGKELYKLELAAWSGSDIFKDSFKEPERIGGYFSYMEGGKPKCLFFSKGENPKVLGVVSFGDISVIETATIDFKEREFQKNEKELYTIRAKALAEIQKDTLFKAYNNTNINLIPTDWHGEKKVYALTAPKITGVVLFGNDYLITFDNANNILNKKKLHRNLIPIEYDNTENAVTSVHSHAEGTNEFITPTDVCTLMLYAKYAGWKEHIVVSENYVSLWDCDNDSLKIITKDKFEEMK